MAIALVAMFVGLVLAPAAPAASDPIASGTTTLTLNKGLVKKLKKNGVKILKVSPATLKNRTSTLPVTGGSLDPTTGAGTINHSGGIKFKRGQKTAALTNLVVDTTTSALTGKVANKSMKIASVSGVTLTRNGFGANVAIAKMKLTSKAAKRLNSKLAPSKKKSNKSSASASAKKPVTNLFKGGQVLGSSASTEQPKTVTILPTNNATLDGNVATLGKFATKGVNPFTGITAIAPAVKPTPTSFNFPISGGALAPDLSSGTLNTSGGVQITKPAGATMQLTNIGVDFATKVALTNLTILPSPPGPGDVGRASIADLVMSGAAVVIDPTTRTFTITGAVANIQAVAAATLNATFPGGTDFAPGDPFGTFSIVAQAQ
jgi:hypothetical protein